MADPISPKGTEYERISLQVEEQDRDLFTRAAEVQEETLTQFLIFSGRERAERLLADRTRFELTPEDWDEGAAVMDREARPNSKLADLFSRKRPD